MQSSKTRFLMLALILSSIHGQITAGDAPAVQESAVQEPSILTMCVQLGKTKEVDALLKGGISAVGTEKIQNQPMYYSIVGDRPDCLYLLLKAGADASFAWSGDGSGFPLSIAAQHGRVRCVELLLDFGAKVEQVDQKGLSSLYRAIIAQNAEIINLLGGRGGRLCAKDLLALTAESRRWMDENKLTVLLDQNPPQPEQAPIKRAPPSPPSK